MAYDCYSLAVDSESRTIETFQHREFGMFHDFTFSQMQTITYSLLVDISENVLFFGEMLFISKLKEGERAQYYSAGSYSIAN